jgi:predicted ester cyclase
MTTAVPTERNTELVVRFFGLLDDHQFDEALALLLPDYQLHFSGQQMNRAQMNEMVRSVYLSFNDLVHDIQETFALGDRVIIRAVIRATHTGDFEGIAPTGRPIAVGQIAIVRVTDDLIAEIREESDMLMLMQQIGALPAPAAS